MDQLSSGLVVVTWWRSSHSVDGCGSGSSHVSVAMGTNTVFSSTRPPSSTGLSEDDITLSHTHIHPLTYLSLQPVVSV